MDKLKRGQSIHDKERLRTLPADEFNNRLANQTLTFVWTKIFLQNPAFIFVLLFSSLLIFVVS